MRITLEELGRQRQQEMLAERHVGVDAHAALRRILDAGAALGLVQRRQHQHAPLIQAAAFGRQLQLARGTVQQARAQALLQPRHQLADGRRRHAAGTRGS
ncbi:hypothetical protein D3C72_2040480 [compost metagenome]